MRRTEAVLDSQQFREDYLLSNGWIKTHEGWRKTGIDWTDFMSFERAVSREPVTSRGLERMALGIRS